MIQAIDRAAAIMRALQGARHLGIKDLAHELSLPPSTVHGLVKSLRQHGLVIKEPHGTRYMLGPALLKLSNAYLDNHEVRGRSMSWTRELARRTGMSVRLGVELFSEVLIIHHNRRPDGSQQMVETGLTIPAHASALGKVLLAYHRPWADHVLAQPLPSLTGETITDASELRQYLDVAAKEVIAQELDEAVLGESSIAVPVADRTGVVVAAVALVLPSTDWPPHAAALNDLRETGRTISRELGFKSWPPRANTAPIA